MAKNITIKKLGGEAKVLDECATVADAKKAADAEGFTAHVNGQPANDSQELRDYDFVALARPVKGGSNL